jgi:hypothetical protein
MINFAHQLEAMSATKGTLSNQQRCCTRSLGIQGGRELIRELIDI